MPRRPRSASSPSSNSAMRSIRALIFVGRPLLTCGRAREISALSAGITQPVGWVHAVMDADVVFHEGNQPRLSFFAGADRLGLS